MHDICAISNLEGFTYTMIRNEDPYAALVQVKYQGLYLTHHDRINARKRLIQKSKAGGTRQQASQFHSATFPTRQGISLHTPQRCKIKLGEQFFQTLSLFSSTLR